MDDVFLIMLIAIALGFVLRFIMASEDENYKQSVKLKRCDIHNWERTNGVLICKDCNWAPELESKIEELFNKSKE